MWLKVVLLSLFGFTNSLTTSFDLRGVVNGNRMASVPLGMSFGDGELDVEGICTQPGWACQNCTLPITCVALPVGWLKMPLKECSEGHTCNAHLGRCSKTPVPECDAATLEYKHSCEQVGIFPDAHDCRKFHLCSPPEGLPDGRPADHRAALCPRHYGYNPQTAQCSVPLSHGQCQEKPVPPCTEVGQYGSLPSSVNHYFVCISKQGVLHPQIFICPHGWNFWGGFCQPEPKPETKESKPSESRSSENKSDAKVENSSEEVVKTETSSVKPSVKSWFWMDALFSTAKTSTYAPDTFLADKFDLGNYESTDDVQNQNDANDFVNSFENEW